MKPKSNANWLVQAVLVNSEVQFKKHPWFLLASIFGFCAVLAGAMGDHMMHLQAGTYQAFVFHTAVRYLMWHALLLMLIGVALSYGYVKNRRPFLHWIAAFLSFGMLFFSGGIFLQMATGYTPIIFFVPIGGTLILLAWLMLIVFNLLALKQ